MGGWFVDIFIEYLFRVCVRLVRLLRSRNWPVTQAKVLSSDCPRALYGCPIATIYYEYLVGGELYGAYYDKPFIVRSSGTEYVEQLKRGSEFTIRVNPDDPTVAVPS